MLKILNLEAGYGKLRVLKGISLHVTEGEIVTIIGANGAGKSTLLNAVAGLIKPMSGEILFDRGPIAGLPAERIVGRGCVLVPERRQIFNSLSVRDNLLLGGYLRWSRDRDGAGADMEKVMELFPILRERGKQLAGTLSGGEQQMLALGRALMAKPRILMLDEPSLGIAPLIVREIFSSVKKLRDSGLTILIVEQNAKASLAAADRGYVIETGNIILEGSAAELLNNQDVQRAYLGRDYEKVND
jgi:branched-chain amino acid transport system ATP-binding protein